ncbi:MAG TPA: hypothetical protein VMJ73_09595 [Rhizomicrobium sp.]|nr:hypothetical protein [Rhizomicrobium sp.]
MQENRILTAKNQVGTDLRPVTGRPDFFVAQSAWSGAVRALCLVFGLTIGWILLFDPAVLQGLSAYHPGTHSAPHL